MNQNVVKRLANRNRVNCLFDVIGQSDRLSFFTEQSIYAQGTEACQGAEKTCDDLGCSAERFCSLLFVVSLLSDQLAELEGTVDVPQLFVLLKVRSGTRRLGRFCWTWGCRDCCILHWFWSQRLLHPPWALESASRMGGEVSSSVFVTLG